jgi:hypothetical protein
VVGWKLYKREEEEEQPNPMAQALQRLVDEAAQGRLRGEDLAGHLSQLGQPLAPPAPAPMPPRALAAPAPNQNMAQQLNSLRITKKFNLN